MNRCRQMEEIKFIQLDQNLNYIIVINIMYLEGIFNYGWVDGKFI